MPHKLCKISARSAQRFGSHSRKTHAGLGSHRSPPPAWARVKMCLIDVSLPVSLVLSLKTEEPHCGVFHEYIQEGPVRAAQALPRRQIALLGRKGAHLDGKPKEDPLRPAQGPFRPTQEFLKPKEGPFRPTKGPLRSIKSCPASHVHIRPSQADVGPF